MLQLNCLGRVSGRSFDIHQGGGKSEHPSSAIRRDKKAAALNKPALRWTYRSEVRTVTMSPLSYRKWGSETAKSLLGARTNQEKGIRL